MTEPSRPCRPTLAERFWPAAVTGALAVVISRNFFQTEKTISHKIVADYDVGDATFARMMSDLMGPPLVEGNRVDLLLNGEQIFPAMLAAIESARETITFENFVWVQGRVTNAFAAVLCAKARAGLQVHVLQDAMGCDDVAGPSLQQMRQAGVKVEIFHKFKLTQMNFRTHRKLLIVDGRIAFLGGVGISDSWQGDGVTAGHWRDGHYRVEGPVVAQAQNAFMDNWMQTRAEVLHGDRYFPALSPAGPMRCQVFRSSVSEAAESARLMFLLSIAAARKSILIGNAFFVPDELFIETLVDAARRGVQVEIIAPGPDVDQKTVRLAGRELWGPLLQAGARIFEYQPARFHCKYLIVDGCWCSVGSTNLDNRSLRLNEEANLNVLDEPFAAAHTEIFERDRQRSREVTLRNWWSRPVSEQMRGRAGLLLRRQI